ncbi:hypothetical protein HMH01_00400 [Halovulum dunhuangense]|uniref:Haem-binding uptake Tiki superfamily ChaN domain-containing protein n=1 Tax=Halovulum dunhuangense TaxID=1505036 RepID=A0A849KZB3_9RHOB|nr:ChaN family lipoprotein [Halovulum dunhuangense]NNU78884.1 hypothetical protein [Halovulum dunhuangense]
MLCGIVAAVVLGAAAAIASGPPMIDAARGAEVVVVGEYHDNPEHHATQAAYAAALSPARSCSR